MGFAPRSDVFSSCHRAALLVRLWALGMLEDDMRLENHCKSRWQNTVLYLDQSTLQVVKIIGRERQWPRRIFLLRAIEGLAVVTSYYPVYLIQARLEF